MKVEYYVPGDNHHRAFEWIEAQEAAGNVVYQNAKGDNGLPYVSLSHGENVEGRWLEVTDDHKAGLLECTAVD